MLFWFFMLVMVLLVPVTMLGFGRRFVNQPPGKINSWFGYRTPMSMKNQDTWAFAHRYCGRLWETWGLLLMPVSFGVMIFFGSGDEGTLGIVGGLVVLAQTVVLTSTLLSTERALQKTFDADGSPRTK